MSRAMLTEADDWESYEDKERGQGLKKLVGGLAATAKKMVDEGGYEIASLAARFADEKRTDELESILSTADTQTRWLLSKKMRADLSGRRNRRHEKKRRRFSQAERGQKADDGLRHLALEISRNA